MTGASDGYGRLKEKPILTKEQAAKLRIFESMVEEYENKGSHWHVKPNTVAGTLVF